MLWKLQSRKFIVLIVWIVFAFIALFKNDIETEVKVAIIQFTGSVSLLYIGGNVAQKYIDKK